MTGSVQGVVQSLPEHYDHKLETLKNTHTFIYHIQAICSNSVCKILEGISVLNQGVFH